MAHDAEGNYDPDSLFRSSHKIPLPRVRLSVVAALSRADPLSQVAVIAMARFDLTRYVGTGIPAVRVIDA